MEKFFAHRRGVVASTATRRRGGFVASPG